MSALTKLPPYVLRFWESEFSFLKPKKSRGHQRLYVQEDIDTVLEIKRMLYDEGYTIVGVKRYWTSRGRWGGRAVPARYRLARVKGHLEAILRRLQAYGR